MSEKCILNSIVYKRSTIVAGGFFSRVVVFSLLGVRSSGLNLN